VAKKQKKDDTLSDIVDKLIDDVGDDRDRLISFLDDLLTEHKDQPAGIAEYVAKLVDASTRQHQVKVSMIKALAKNGPTAEEDDADELDEIHKEIGLPFDEGLDEGSN